MDLKDLLTMGGLIVTLLIFILQQRRLIKIEKQENYLQLELSSNDLFRYEAEYGDVLAPYKENRNPGETRSIKSDAVADQFFLQTLNLFEIAARFRRAYAFEPEIFGSWVIWYYDAHCSWWFRERWPEYRINYTPDLRSIFDGPVAAFDPDLDDEARRRAFFDHVARLFKCPIVKRWLDEPKR